MHSQHWLEMLIFIMMLDIATGLISYHTPFEMPGSPTGMQTAAVDSNGPWSLPGVLGAPIGTQGEVKPVQMVARPASRSVAEMISMQELGDKLARLQSCLGRQFKFFILVSSYRSGSRMVGDMLNSHPDIFMSNHELECPEEYKCLEITCNSLSARLLGFNGTHVGFKLMLDQLNILDNMGMFPDKLNLTVIPHFRRNRLRWVISGYPGQNCGYNTSTSTCKYPENEKDAESLRVFKPTLDVTASLPIMQSYFMKERALMNKLRTLSDFSPLCISHYEDWVNPATKYAQENNLEMCLRVRGAPLTTKLKPIHQTQPLFSTIVNGEEVAHRLRGTVYEYMLEDAGSPDAVYDKLRAYDNVDHSWVAGGGGGESNPKSSSNHNFKRRKKWWLEREG